jgi:hypothetical protein
MAAHAFICWLCDFVTCERLDIEAPERDTGHRAIADLAAAVRGDREPSLA